MATKRPSLRVAQFEAKTLSWWNARAKQIDMNPPYQRRGKLWSISDKAYLIDSIINSFDVPKLYMADFNYISSPLNRKKLPYAIIDGKQRLEAIFDFFSGEITLNPDFVFLEDPELPLGGLGYRDLKQSYPEVAELFENFNLSVMSVVTTDEELIRQLFVRLNRSKPLTGAEIRNAMTGPAPAIIQGLAQHEFFTESIAFDVKRGQDLNASAKILMFEFYGKPHETKKRNMDGFVVEAGERHETLELAARRAKDNLTDLTSVFLPHDKLLSSAGSIPVYYWFVRQLDPGAYKVVRQFLVEFEAARRRNRQITDGLAPGVRDAELVEYDNFNRNTNDQVSHTGRLEILNKRFRTYVRSRAVQAALLSTL